MVLMLAWLLYGQDHSAQAERLGILLKARYAMAKGDTAQALIFCDQAIQMDPTDADAAYLKVELLEEQEPATPAQTLSRQRSLVSSLKTFTHQFPDDYRFPMTLGIMLVKERLLDEDKDLEEPGTYLDRAIALMGPGEDLKSQRSDIWYYLGLDHFRAGRLYYASHAFSEVVKLEPNAGWAWYYAARSLEGSHQLRTALRFYEKYLTLAAYDPIQYDIPVPYTVYLLRLLVTPSQAHQKALVTWIQEQEDVRELHFQAIQRLISVAQNESALALLEIVPEENRDLSYYRLVSLVRMALHQYDVLYKEITDAMERFPEELRRFLVDYAMEAALCGGNYNEALVLRRTYPLTPGADLKLDLYAAFAETLGTGETTYWETLRTRHLQSDLMDNIRSQVTETGLQTVALRNMGQLAIQWKDWPIALVHLRALHKRLPEEATTSDDLAVVHYLMGKTEEAFAMYDALVKANPERIDLLNNYAYFLTESGQHLQRAKALMEKVLEKDATTGAYLDSMAWVHFKLGDLEQAQALLEQALALEPNDPEKLEHLGDVYEAMDKTHLARDAWVRAMENADDRYLQILDKLDPPI